MKPPSPRLYVASLAAYNEGILCGAWIDADSSKDSMLDAIAEMLKTDPEHGEEFAIHDHDGFGGVRIGEYETLGTIAEMMELFEQHGETTWDVLEYADDLEHAKSLLSEGFGPYRSEEDWAMEYAIDAGMITDDHPLFHFIDFKAMARDFGADRTIIKTSSGVLVFND